MCNCKLKHELYKIKSHFGYIYAYLNLVNENLDIIFAMHFNLVRAFMQKVYTKCNTGFTKSEKNRMKQCQRKDFFTLSA